MIYMDDDNYFAHRVGDTVHAAWGALLNHHLPGTNASTGTPHKD